MTETLTRSYPVSVHANTAKHVSLKIIHREGIRTVRCQIHHLMDVLTRTGELPQRLNTTGLPTVLSARYAAELSSNALGSVRSWKTHVKNHALNTLRSSTVKSTCGTDFYRYAYRLVSFGYAMGAARDVSPKVSAGLTLTDADKLRAHRLCRSVVRRSIARHRRPRLSSNASLTLGAKVITVDLSSSVSFDGVISFAGMKPRTPVHVPINLPVYTSKKLSHGTTLLSCVQLAPNPSGGMRLRVTGKTTVQHGQLNENVVIGVDVGAVHPITTSLGEFFGNRLWERVRHYDVQLIAAMKGVQERGGRKHWNTSARYRNAVRRLRGFVKNEIRRALNRIMELHAPSEIVIEHLDSAFAPMQGSLSRRMRRLLRNVGRQVFREKLSSLSMETGVKITEVTAAYTSQGCHCGNTDVKNRPCQETFRCTRCGRKRNADVHASTMIRGRRSVTGLSRVQGSSARLGGRKEALAHQRKLTSVWCGERRIRPEESAGAGRERKFLQPSKTNAE